MALQISEIGTGDWAAYFAVSPTFLVESVLECEVVNGGLGGITLREKVVSTPYAKYDQSERHTEWAKHFDLRTWGVFLATEDGQPVGGGAVAPPSPAMIVSNGRPDTAALFDVRVSAAVRNRGIGAAIFGRCVQWAKSRGFKFLAIETQDNNIPACRFYAKKGCELLEIRRFAYRDSPRVENETMLVWRLTL